MHAFNFPSIDNKKIKYLGSAQFKGYVDNCFYSDAIEKYFKCTDAVPARNDIFHRCEARFVFDNNLALHITFSEEYFLDADKVIDGVMKVLLKARQDAENQLKNQKNREI